MHRKYHLLHIRVAIVLVLVEQKKIGGNLSRERPEDIRHRSIILDDIEEKKICPNENMTDRSTIWAL